MAPGFRSPYSRSRRTAGAGYGRLESSLPSVRTPAAGSFGGRRSLLARAAARGSPLRSMDWVLNGAVLGLTVLSTLLIWSATRPQLLQAGGDPQAFLKKQVLNVVIGFVLLGAVSMLDYRTLRAYAPIGYLLACLGLLAVLTPLGATINGARSWIVIGGGYEVEPSEFAKVTLVLVVALVLGELREGDRAPRGRDLALAIAVSLPALGLVLLQPDLSVAIVMAVVIFGMVVVSGTRLRWIAALLIHHGRDGAFRLAAAPAQAVPDPADHRLRPPDGQPERLRLRREPGADHHRVGRDVRAGPVPRRPDHRPLRPRAADRLHLHRRG